MDIVIDSFRRVAWGCASLLYGVLLLSAFQLPHVPVWIPLVMVLLAVVCAVRPATGFLVLAVAAPSASFFARQIGVVSIAWAELLMIAAATGWSARRTLSRHSDDAASADAAGLMAAVVVSAVAAAVGMTRIALGPVVWTDLAQLLTHTYFIDLRSIPGLHPGLLLLEGLTLLSCARWIFADDRDALARLAGALAGGAALAAAVNVAVLVHAAWGRAPFWPVLFETLTYVRYNAHYRDVNAAGSFFVMCLIAGLSAAGTAPAGWRRRGLMLLSACAAAGLWTSGSRTAMVAGALAAAAALAWRVMRARGRRARVAVAIALAAIGVTAVAAYYLPIRSSQHSAGIAMTVRVELAAAAARMIAIHPIVGVGIGEFPERVGEFASPRLLETFPPAAHENAHNNFIQIAAELGALGFAAFVWLMAIVLADAARGLTQDPLRTGVCIALGAFVITCIGGHPLLVPEAGYPFWMLLGTAAGTPAFRAPLALPRVRVLMAVCAVLMLMTTPFRVRALVEDANFEHLAIGVSAWQISPDGTRYRVATDDATLFVPANEAFAFDVQPIAGAPVRLELRLDGRTADIVTLRPGVWQDMTLPARSARVAGKYSRLELRLLDPVPGTVLWISKVRALGRPVAEVHWPIEPSS